MVDGVPLLRLQLLRPTLIANHYGIHVIFNCTMMYNVYTYFSSFWKINKFGKSDSLTLQVSTMLKSNKKAKGFMAHMLTG